MPSRRSSQSGFLLAEAILALALLGMIMFFVAQFEGRARASSQRLTQEYTATAAAESQFERLRAGLDVLDTETFRKRYPGLRLEYHVEQRDGGERTSVIAVKSDDLDERVLFSLSAPTPTLAASRQEAQP